MNRFLIFPLLIYLQFLYLIGAYRGRSKIDDQIIQLESELEKAVTSAKTEGEKLVDSNVEKATKQANAETQKTIEEAKTKSKDITSQITAQKAQDIVKMLLKGVE